MQKGEKILDVIARRSSGFEVEEDELRYLFRKKYKAVTRVINEIALTITETKDSSLYCKMCGAGGFTKRGMYQHLTRKHGKEILKIMKEARGLIDLSVKLNLDFRIVSAVVEKRNGKYLCKLCGREIARNGLYRHLTAKHERELEEETFRFKHR